MKNEPPAYVWPDDLDAEARHAPKTTGGVVERLPTEADLDAAFARLFDEPGVNMPTPADLLEPDQVVAILKCRQGSPETRRRAALARLNALACPVVRVSRKVWFVRRADLDVALARPAEA